MTQPDIAQLYENTGIDLSELPPVATASELAPILRTTEPALAQDRYRGIGVPYIKHGRRVRYLRADVARYLIANRRQGTAVGA